MSTPTIASPTLLAGALANARTQLAADATTDINDDLAVIRSNASLADALRRVLWVFDAEDDEPDVAAQVAMEDGVRSIGVPYQRTTDAVTA
ncbi:hypothetical protein ACWEAF_26295 [Streptomyces sp. NPDC005071]